MAKPYDGGKPHRMLPYPIKRDKRMTFMLWSSEIAVGLNDVDDQHRWLVDRINHLHSELSSPAPESAAVAEVLEGLMDYTMNHFIMEEELFERHAYPDTEAHKAQHNKFTSTIMEALTEHEDGKNVSHEVLDFLKHWLTHHIMRTDKMYVPFMLERGVS